MMSKKNSQESSNKRLKMSLQIKAEIIEKREQGMSVANLARSYNRSASTICTILKNKDKIKKVDASKGVTRISTQRMAILDDVERLLLIWMNEKQLQGDCISEKVICEKAKSIFTDLIKKTPGSSTAEKEGQFKASRGWFEKFKRRTGIHSVMRHGEGASFIVDFKKFVDSEGYDISEFVEVHIHGLNTEDLVELSCVPQQEDVEESSSGEEEKDATMNQSSGEIREILKAWETVASFIEKHHPNKTVAMLSKDLFHNNVMSHFYQISERQEGLE